MTRSDNQTANPLARRRQHADHHKTAPPDCHPDCRAPFIQIVALHAVVVSEILKLRQLDDPAGLVRPKLGVHDSAGGGPFRPDANRARRFRLHAGSDPSVGPHERQAYAETNVKTLRMQQDRTFSRTEGKTARLPVRMRFDTPWRLREASGSTPRSLLLRHTPRKFLTERKHAVANAPACLETPWGPPGSMQGRALGLPPTCRV